MSNPSSPFGGQFDTQSSLSSESTSASGSSAFVHPTRALSDAQRVSFPGKSLVVRIYLSVVQLLSRVHV